MKMKSCELFAIILFGVVFASTESSECLKNVLTKKFGMINFHLLPGMEAYCVTNDVRHDVIYAGKSQSEKLEFARTCEELGFDIIEKNEMEVYCGYRNYFYDICDGDVLISSSFSTRFNCSLINGDLIIQNVGIENQALEGLANLKKIRGRLVVRDNLWLNGRLNFESLEDVGELVKNSKQPVIKIKQNLINGGIAFPKLRMSQCTQMYNCFELSENTITPITFGEVSVNNEKGRIRKKRETTTKKDPAQKTHQKYATKRWNRTYMMLSAVLASLAGMISAVFCGLLFEKEQNFDW